MTSTPTGLVAGPVWTRPAVPITAGVGYTLAWLVGLSVAPASTDVTSTGAQVIAATTGHTDSSAVQYGLTEIVAALALAVVVWSVAGLAVRRLARVEPGHRIATLRAAGALLGTARVAVIISVLQGITGVYLALSVIPADQAGRAGTLFDLINRADGVKMGALMVMAAASIALVRSGVLPGGLMFVAVPLAVALLLSGLGYLFLVNGLAVAAYVSLPLLLVWVTAAGLIVGREL